MTTNKISNYTKITVGILAILIVLCVPKLCEHMTRHNLKKGNAEGYEWLVFSPYIQRENWSCMMHSVTNIDGVVSGKITKDTKIAEVPGGQPFDRRPENMFKAYFLFLANGADPDNYYQNNIAGKGVYSNDGYAALQRLYANNVEVFVADTSVIPIANKANAEIIKRDLEQALENYEMQKYIVLIYSVEDGNTPHAVSVVVNTVERKIYYMDPMPSPFRTSPYEPLQKALKSRLDRVNKG